MCLFNVKDSQRTTRLDTICLRYYLFLILNTVGYLATLLYITCLGRWNYLLKKPDYKSHPYFLYTYKSRLLNRRFTVVLPKSEDSLEMWPNR